jgi:hypothetical protein
MLYKGESINETNLHFSQTYVCIIRIRWLGYLVRMEENSPCKKVTFSQPEGSRKKGRPKLRWLDSVLKDVKLLKVETRWKKALDWNIWGSIIKKSRVHKGL